MTGDWYDPDAPTTTRVAHAVCPYCYPDEPADGDPVKRLCGITLPAERIPDGERPTACADGCNRHGQRCPDCRAVSTLFGMIPPGDPNADKWAAQ